MNWYEAFSIGSGSGWGQQSSAITGQGAGRPGLLALGDESRQN